MVVEVAAAAGVGSVGSVEAWRIDVELGANRMCCADRVGVGRCDGRMGLFNGLLVVEKADRVGWYVVRTALVAMGMLSRLALEHMSEAMLCVLLVNAGSINSDAVSVVRRSSAVAWMHGPRRKLVACECCSMGTSLSNPIYLEYDKDATNVNRPFIYNKQEMFSRAWLTKAAWMEMLF